MDQMYTQSLSNCDTDNIFCGKIYKDNKGAFNYTCTFCELQLACGLEFENHVLNHFLDEKCDDLSEKQEKQEELVLVRPEPFMSVDIYSSYEDYPPSKQIGERNSEEAQELNEDSIDVLKEQTPRENIVNKKSLIDVLYDISVNKNQKQSNIKCVCCYQKFACNGLRDLHLHQSAHPYMKCEQCPTFFPDRRSRRIHIRLHQKPENVLFKCLHCNRVLPTEDSLNNHIFVNQKPDILPETPAKLDRVQEPTEPSYECDICGRKFKVKFYLEKHLLKHTQNQLDCHICKLQFKNNGVLRYHMQKHTGEKNYKCTVCDKSFMSPTYVKQHMRLHTGEKPFVCQQCGKAFFCCSSLTRHIRLIHERVRNHVCEVCNDRFATPGCLKDHVRSIHTFEKPFSCPDCDRTFARSKTLRQHRLLHREKKFKCNFCDKYFAQSAGRRGHEKHFHRAA